MTTLFPNFIFDPVLGFYYFTESSQIPLKRFRGAPWRTEANSPFILHTQQPNKIPETYWWQIWNSLIPWLVCPYLRHDLKSSFAGAEGFAIFSAQPDQGKEP